MKDWTGNNQSAYTCNGCSNHSDDFRECDDYYATEPKATQILLNSYKFNKKIWECACGELHMSNVLKSNGYLVKNSDLILRTENIEQIDFLHFDGKWDGDIITNPPYKYAKEFVEKALSIINVGNNVAMFLKLTFLESKARRALFDNFPPKVILVSSSRLQCAKNGDFKKYHSGTGTAIAYAWYIWEKGFAGDPIIKWVN